MATLFAYAHATIPTPLGLISFAQGEFPLESWNTLLTCSQTCIIGIEFFGSVFSGRMSMDFLAFFLIQRL